jgi:transketolase
VSDEVREYFAGLKVRRGEVRRAWERTFEAWSAANPGLRRRLDAAIRGEVPGDLLSRIPAFPAEGKAATRNSGGEILQVVAEAVPQLVTGSADLFGSTKNYIRNGGDFSAVNPAGRNIWFGIREHGMCAICNGIAYDGIFRASGATFLVFADYCRPSLRLAALARLPVLYIFTHDSVGVGEDGPTHQPVETVSSLRLIPNLDVIRPADAEECAAAFVAALERTEGPTLLALSRQDLPHLGFAGSGVRRDGVARGGYVLRPETGALEAIVMATGSEVQHAVAAAADRPGVRVVSMPCLERFDRQPQEYRDSVLPPACVKRVAIEAGVTGLWWKYVGSGGRVVGIDRFGLSAPGNAVMKELGMTPDRVGAALG